MTRPIDKLKKSATFVVWASMQERGGLTLGEKVVWYHTWGLDQEGDDACYISDRSLAGRLGLKIRTIQQLRYRMRALGLLASFKRIEGDNLGWIAILPQECHPSSGRAAGSEAVALAEKLDAYLRKTDPARATLVAKKATAIASETPTRSPGSLSSGKAVAVVVQSEAQLPPAVTSTEVGEVAKATGTTKSNRKKSEHSEQLGMPGIELRLVAGMPRTTDPEIRAAIDALDRNLRDTA